MSRFAFAFLPLLVVCAATAAAQPHPTSMNDSTTTEAWRLANGLEIRVRAIPGAAGASVSLAYRAGALHVPPARAGLAQLLAELQFTEAAGSVPERSREDLANLRPAGWDVRTNDHLTVLTEVAGPNQLAGVLAQVAARAHGVKVTPAGFQRSSATVRAGLAREAFGDPASVLYLRVRQVALGKDDATILAEARGKGLDGIDAAAAGQLLRRLYVPANATLALAGDFAGVDLHALLAQLFGDIPAGVAEPEAVSPRLRPGMRTVRLPGLQLPTGVLAVIAPPLDDSTHAPFYLAGLLAGGWWRDAVGAPRRPLTTVFRYSVLDEPDLVRFYVQPSAALIDSTALTGMWTGAIDELRERQFMPGLIDQFRSSIEWLLGGPISPPMLEGMRRNTSALSELSFSMATRGCWRGDDFWNAWRHRLETSPLSPQMFFGPMLEPSNHVTVLLEPRP